MIRDELPCGPTAVNVKVMDGNQVLVVHNIVCSHSGRRAVKGLSFSVSQGSLVCLLGPSGCGKTTVLRAIAGFHPLDRGEIRLGGRLVSRSGYVLAPERRRVGMVFQDHALFPHLRVRDNVAFGLNKKPSGDSHILVSELLERVGLSTMGDRYPHELSGGQQQRVALARALAPSPDLLLMDEPFSNLDVELRERLSYEVRGILKEQGTTSVLVTHDQHDAFSLSDKVGVMADGQIMQWDTPYNLYHEPSNRFVADFIGEGVFLPGTLLDARSVETELGTVRGDKDYALQAGAVLDVLIRPDDIVPDPDSRLVGRVVRKTFKGAEILYTLRLDSGTQVLSLFPSHANHGLGEAVAIRLQADHLVAFAHDA